MLKRFLMRRPSLGSEGSRVSGWRRAEGNNCRIAKVGSGLATACIIMLRTSFSGACRGNHASFPVTSVCGQDKQGKRGGLDLPVVILIISFKQFLALFKVLPASPAVGLLPS